MSSKSRTWLLPAVCECARYFSSGVPNLSSPILCSLPLVAGTHSTGLSLCLVSSVQEQAGGVTSSLFCLGICPSALILLINRAQFIRGNHTDTYAYDSHRPAFNLWVPPPLSLWRNTVFIARHLTCQLLTSSMFQHISPSIYTSIRQLEYRWKE